MHENILIKFNCLTLMWSLTFRNHDQVKIHKMSVNQRKNRHQIFFKMNIFLLKINFCRIQQKKIICFKCVTVKTLIKSIFQIGNQNDMFPWKNNRCHISHWQIEQNITVRLYMSIQLNFTKINIVPQKNQIVLWE